MFSFAILRVDPLLSSAHTVPAQSFVLLRCIRNNVPVAVYRWRHLARDAFACSNRVRESHRHRSLLLQQVTAVAARAVSILPDREQ
jgi:hypothetical protein